MNWRFSHVLYPAAKSASSEVRDGTMRHTFPSARIPMFRLLSFCLLFCMPAVADDPPNIVLIYADDLGYGDLGCYGATTIQTPHIDRLAEQGLRFTAAYATSATCTPSRYGLLTGNYPWRRQGTRILAGDASMIIPPGSATLPSVLRRAGYRTGVIGKWHLGLGTAEEPVDWNSAISSGPLQVGFDHSFIMAATGDRVPTVFVENHRVVNLDPADPIQVSYKRKIGDWPTGRENPGLMKFGADDQHSDTITHGVSRIGFMTGGKAALWKDEELGDRFTAETLGFIEREKAGPFFLFFALHEPHVPRVPAPRFAGKSPHGPRGDAIAQLDDHVGAVITKLRQLKLLENTLVILTSDNGPVLDDGYEDDAVGKIGDHKPSGPFSGGKYSKLEAGTRVPMIVSWPGKISPGVSAAVCTQLDFLASFAMLVGQPVPACDSRDAIDVLLGKSTVSRAAIVQEGISGLALRAGDWKYIPPHKGPSELKGMRSGNHPRPQLYLLAEDPAETRNLAEANPEKTKELAAMLAGITANHSSNESH
jgi:arylsulfatase A-like enzyme